MEPHRSTIYRRKLQKENPDKYEEMMQKKREADRRRRAEKKRIFEQEPHSNAELEERERLKQAKRYRTFFQLHQFVMILIPQSIS